MKNESQKLDDLPILVICQSGTLPLLSSKVNDPVAHGSVTLFGCPPCLGRSAYGNETLDNKAYIKEEGDNL